MYDLYLKALVKEYLSRRNEVQGDMATFYVGGGTPSIIPVENMAWLMEQFPRPVEGAECTIEVNPEDVTLQNALAWRDMGFNRVSMGAQSFIDTELDEVGRRHDSQDIHTAYHWITAVGLRNVSLDLIYGLPGQTLRTWQKSVDTLLELAPAHFSAYLLMVEKGTLIYAKYFTGRFKEADDDLVNAMYSYLCEKAREAGYVHYEISNWAKPGYQSRHNSAYWDFRPYLGLGAGAHSFDGKVRRFNKNDVRDFVFKMEYDKIFYTIDEESPIDLINDRILVGLRKMSGLNLDSLDERAAEKVLDNLKMVPRELYRVEGSVLRIPEEKMLMSDAVIRTLMLD